MAATVLKVQVGEDVVGPISYDPTTLTQLVLSMGLPQCPLYLYGFCTTIFVHNTPSVPNKCRTKTTTLILERREYILTIIVCLFMA